MAGELWECGVVDGSTVSAIGRIQLINNLQRILAPNMFNYVGRATHIRASGRISVNAGAPEHLHLSWSHSSSGTFITTITPQIHQNTEGVINVPWILDMTLICREIMPLVKMNMAGWFVSQGVAGSQVPTVGGNGFYAFNVEHFLNTGVSQMTEGNDANWTLFVERMTGATGSIQVHNYIVTVLN